MGLTYSVEAPVDVQYEGQVVGEYFADLLIGSDVILELKAVKSLTSEHSAQLINYLRATQVPVGLLVNFHGPKPEIKRLFCQRNTVKVPNKPLRNLLHGGNDVYPVPAKPDQESP